MPLKPSGYGRPAQCGGGAHGRGPGSENPGPPPPQLRRDYRMRSHGRPRRGLVLAEGRGRQVRSRSASLAERSGRLTPDLIPLSESCSRRGSWASPTDRSTSALRPRECTIRRRSSGIAIAPNFNAVPLLRTTSRRPGRRASIALASPCLPERQVFRCVPLRPTAGRARFGSRGDAHQANCPRGTSSFDQ